MKYGITSTHNQDLMFIGQRQNGSGFDVTDVVVGWADNSGPGAVGPDNMVFDFLGGAAGGTDDLLGTSLNGREIMRLTGYGNVGIGPRFNNNFQPQSTLHQHQENSAASWMQISNQLSGGVANAAGPSPIAATDGLRWGIDGANTAYLYNQENNHLLFSTNNTAGGNFAGTAERMRITHIGAPGTVNPAGIPNNITRVSISHNPNAPVTRPLSLLHLGYNTGGVSLNPNATDGWRPWMDIGMFVTNNTDNVYIGLKNENGPLGDRQDAVLSWGDNQVSGFPAGNGPDNFRFIFTSTTAGSGGGTPPATGANGLEGMRMTPTANTGVFTGIGGDPTANLYSTGTQTANNTLEVNSWGATNAQGGSSGLRFTNLNTTSPTIANPGQGVLSVNAQGDVVYVLSNPPSSFGAACSAPVATSNLASDWRIGMNNFSVNFDGTGNVNIGDLQGCVPGSSSPARLWVRNTFGGVNPNTSFRIDHNPIPGSYAAEIFGNVFIGGTGVSPGPGLIFSDTNFKDNIALLPSALDLLARLKPVSYNLNNSYAPQLSNDTSKTYGLIAQQVERVIPELVKTVTIPAGYDGAGAVTSPSLTAKALNYTGLIPFMISGVNELSVKQKQLQAQIDKAGLSDQQVKTNVNNFNALAKIKTLNPVKYNFTNANVPQLSFTANDDYGFIAQQLETVYPELIDSLNVPAKLDSAGNVVNAAKTLKTVNYKAMSALLVRSIQEQQLTIDSLRTVTKKQDSINNSVQQQIAALASQINGCCSNAQSRINKDNGLNQQDVELSDKEVIVLNQNVPNPFAEQTTITYNVPESVGKAQIIFYNSAGQIIQTVDIKTRGKGKVNVFASDLSSGLYHYTLVADGKVIDSKKMVRE